MEPAENVDNHQMTAADEQVALTEYIAQVNELQHHRRLDSQLIEASKADAASDRQKSGGAAARSPRPGIFTAVPTSPLTEAIYFTAG